MSVAVLSWVNTILQHTGRGDLLNSERGQTYQLTDRTSVKVLSGSDGYDRSYEAYLIFDGETIYSDGILVTNDFIHLKGDHPKYEAMVEDLRNKSTELMDEYARLRRQRGW